MKKVYIATETDLITGLVPETPEVVKIGTTEVTPFSRVKDLQCGNPRLLHILRVIEGDFERWFHRQYAGLRLRMQNEWFKFDPTMLTIQPPESSLVLPTPTWEERADQQVVEMAKRALVFTPQTAEEETASRYSDWREPSVEERRNRMLCTGIVEPKPNDVSYHERSNHFARRRPSAVGECEHGIPSRGCVWCQHEQATGAAWAPAERYK
jgi:hypothetical protein